MKITITLPDTTYEPYIFYTEPYYFREKRILPITKIREEMEGTQEYIISDIENLFILPNKINKEIDLSYNDGYVHYTALYKPNEWSIRVKSLEEHKLIRNLEPIHATRGLFYVQVETEWGTTINFTSTVVSFDENRTLLTFKNSKAIYNVEQNTTYLYDYTKSGTRLFPSNIVFPGKGLYPEIYYDLVYNESNRVLVVNPKEWEITINSNAKISGGNLFIDKVIVNGTTIDVNVDILDQLRLTSNDYPDLIKVQYNTIEIVLKEGLSATTPNDKIQLSLYVNSSLINSTYMI